MSRSMCNPSGLAQAALQAGRTSASASMFLPKLSVAAAKASSSYTFRVATFIAGDAKSLLTEGALVKVRLAGLRPKAI